MEQTATTQQEFGPQVGQREETRRSRPNVSAAYARFTGKARGLFTDVKGRLPFRQQSPAMEPTFARAARLTVWAPSAVLGAVTGAALASATAVWTAALFWRSDADAGRIIAIATFVVGSMFFMVMFASSPSVSQTMKRLWAGVSVILLFLGGLALLLAINITFQHFTGSSPLGLSR